MDKWLEVALDYGISEYDFWMMTPGELQRAIESKKRIELEKAKEKASFDYILAEIIGRSIARIHSSTNEMPKIASVYPSLFTEEEVEEKLQEKKDELSMIRFKQFTQQFNKKFEEVGE